MHSHRPWVQVGLGGAALWQMGWSSSSARGLQYLSLPHHIELPSCEEAGRGACGRWGRCGGVRGSQPLQMMLLGMAPPVAAAAALPPPSRPPAHQAVVGGVEAGVVVNRGPTRRLVALGGAFGDAGCHAGGLGLAALVAVGAGEALLAHAEVVPVQTRAVRLAAGHVGLRGGAGAATGARQVSLAAGTAGAGAAESAACRCKPLRVRRRTEVEQGKPPLQMVPSGQDCCRSPSHQWVPSMHLLSPTVQVGPLGGVDLQGASPSIPWQ